MRLASRYDQDEVVAAPTHHRGHEVVEGQARNAIVPTRFLRPEPYVLADGRESYASVASECAIAFHDFVHDRDARPLFFHPSSPPSSRAMRSRGMPSSSRGGVGFSVTALPR